MRFWQAMWDYNDQKDRYEQHGRLRDDPEDAVTDLFYEGYDISTLVEDRGIYFCEKQNICVGVVSV
jgi:hypothetical protein